jgi:hypothetical protein
LYEGRPAIKLVNIPTHRLGFWPWVMQDDRHTALLIPSFLEGTSSSSIFSLFVVNEFLD